jgi:hypothetical protein
MIFSYFFSYLPNTAYQMLSRKLNLQKIVTEKEKEKRRKSKNFFEYLVFSRDFGMRGEGS